MKRFWSALMLIRLLFRRLIWANLRLARDISRFRIQFYSATIAYSAQDMSIKEMVLLGTLISLTPGTLTIDLDDKQEILYIHNLYAENLDLFQKEIDQFAGLIRSLRKAKT